MHGHFTHEHMGAWKLCAWARVHGCTTLPPPPFPTNSPLLPPALHPPCPTHLSIPHSLQVHARPLLLTPLSCCCTAFPLLRLPVALRRAACNSQATSSVILCSGMVYLPCNLFFDSLTLFWVCCTACFMITHDAQQVAKVEC